MDDLIAFWTARLDEDEAAAKARRGIFPSPGVEDSGSVWLHIKRGGNAVVVRYTHPVEGYGDMADLRAWADTDQGWTQDRVLREVEAGRQLLSDYEEAEASYKEAETAREAEVAGIVREILLMQIINRARVYSDHPDFRAEWKP